MEPVHDDLDARVRRAAQVEQAAVERVVEAVLSPQARTLAPQGGRLAPGATALASGGQQLVHRGRATWPWPASFAVAAASLVSIVSLGVWWTARTPVGGKTSARMITTSHRVVGVSADDGTRWIFSTPATEDLLPPGSVVVITGEEAR